MVKKKMIKKKEISILIAGAVLLTFGYFYFDTSNSLFGIITNQFVSPNWDEIHPRNLVKNSIPIILLETNGNSCIVKAETFEMITSHPYFIKNYEITKELQYNSNEKTLVIPCDQLHGEKSRLHVWYVVQEAPQHATKWKYFITAWDEVP